VRIAALVATGAAWVVVIAVARVATDLRPLADDYCHGAKATLGYVGSLAAWFQTWIGDLFQLSITALLVGQPLAHLPFSLASAIPFLVTLLVVGLAAFVAIAGAPVGVRGDRILFLALAVPILMITWLGFWWVPATIEPSQSTDPWLLAAAMTDWQTVVVQYALVPALLIGAAILLTFRRGQRPWVRVVLFGLLGLASGLGGLVFGVASLAVVPLLLVGRIIHDRAVSTARVVETSAFTVLCAAGIAIAYFAPGSGVRNASLLGVRPFGEEVTLGELVRWVLPQGVIQGVGMLVGAGTIVAFLVGVSIALAGKKLGVVGDPAVIASVGLGLVFFSLVIAVASRAADGFSYEAFWHEVVPRTVIFLGVSALGAAVGTWLGRYPHGAGRMAQVVALAAGAVVALAVIGSLLVMQSHVQDRLAQWSVGAAPSSSLDLETKWVQDCWATIEDFRPVPDLVP
jgi:hypothetical protein